MNIKSNESNLVPKERALVALVAYLAMNRDSENLNCALRSAKAEGFTENDINRIKNYVEDMRCEKPEEDSLASMLAKATKSNCCS